MLYAAAGVGFDATRLARNPPVHQLTSHLALRFETEACRTHMHVDRQQPPWRVVRAFAQDNGSSLVHLHNVSGGVLSGDHLTLDIDVSPGGSAQVTTTGATRLYRHRQGSAGSEQHTNIRVGEGALLEYLPDALIPYARSRHLQRTSVSLADRATLLWWEIVAPGRQATGETSAFDCLRLQTEIRSRRGSLLIENIVLEPAVRPLQSPARLGPYSHVANFYAFSVGLPQSRWAELEAEIRDLCTTRSTAGAMIWGLSTLAADGLVVRGLSVSARELPAMLAGIWKITKRSLTGEEAVLPRKVY